MKLYGRPPTLAWDSPCVLVSHLVAHISTVGHVTEDLNLHGSNSNDCWEVGKENVAT